MSLRFDYRKVDRAAFLTLGAFSLYEAKGSLDKTLRGLIKIRVSQLNGCTFCLDMHMRDARKLGEREERLEQLSIWRESTLYSPAEREALAFAEEVTQIADGGVSQSTYEAAREHFSEKQVLELIMAAIAINSWNRIAIATGMSHP